MKPFLKYQDAAVEQSYLAHIFFLASLGFNIVPGRFWANGIACDYESSPEGIRITKQPEGAVMLLPFQAAMALVSNPIGDK